ncbi:MAG: FAD-dependent oxidoreductase [Candidatus Micrarchaeota archaeon]
MYDVLIVGAGPAGMSAAIYSARKALSTVIIESKSIGGATARAPIVENYPGVEKLTGVELSERMRKQVESFGVKITIGSVVGVSRSGEYFKIKTTDSEYDARAVVLATGSYYEKLGIPGEKEFLGKGVSYCATCDGAFFSGKKVAVIGGGNTALSAAIMMCDIASDIYLVHRKKELRGDESLQQRLGRTGLVLGYAPKSIVGDRFVTALELEHMETKEKKTLAVDGIFINIGTVPSSDIAKSIGAEVDERGNIKVDCNGATNIPGLFAAGDVTGGINQIVIAAAQGAAAAIGAHQHIKYGKSI